MKSEDNNPYSNSITKTAAENNLDVKRIKMVHIDEINIEKENVIPLKSGRKAIDLAEKFSEHNYNSNPHQRMQNFEEKRKTFEKRIASMDLTTEDDPLDHYYQYIKWMQEECTFEHAELMKVVERGVRQFRKDIRYNNDPRFLKMWLLVAKSTKEPLEVFKYLSVNGIGVQISTYYEEYAGYMEVVGRLEEASEIFERGIERQAQPLERLMRKFEEFKVRIKQFSNHQSTAESNPYALQDASEFTSSARQQGSQNVLKPLSKKQTSTIKVYQDSEETLENPLPTSSEDGKWDDFNSISIGKKENNLQSEVMHGATLKQTGPTTSSSRPEFAVFKDTRSSSSTQKTSTAENVSRKDGGGNTASAPPIKKEEIVCDLSLLYIGDEEFSLEEIRALRIGYALIDDETQQPQHEDNHSIDMEIETVQSIELQISESSYSNITELPSATKTVLQSKESGSVVPVTMMSVPVSVPPISTGLTSVKVPVPGNVPTSTTATTTTRQAASPTINTKNALQDVFQMFNQPLLDEADAEDMTISSKVYKPEITPFTIPTEFDEDEDDIPPPTSRFLVADDDNNENHYASSSSPSNPKREEEQQQQPLYESNGPLSSCNLNSSSSRKPLSNKAVSLETTEETPYVFQGERSKDYPIESTPYQHKVSSSSLDSLRRPSFGQTLQRIPQNFNIMTPIAEASYEDRTFAGLSTIKSVRVRDVDEHTATTLADRTILTSLGDRTIGSIHGVDENSSHPVDFSHLLSTDTTSNFKLPDLASDLNHGQAALGLQSDLKMTSQQVHEQKSYPSLSSFHVHPDMDNHLEEEQVSELHHSKSIDERPPTPAKLNHHEGTNNNVIEEEYEFPNPCNPRSRSILTSLLASVLPYLKSLDTLHDNRQLECDFLDLVSRLHFNKKNIGRSQMHERAIPIQLSGCGSYTVQKKIGDGAFASIFLARKTDLSSLGFDSDEDDDEDESGVNKLSALKIQKTPYPWEFYILNQLDERLPVRVRESIVHPLSCHVFADCICLNMSFCDQGSLVDCLNFSIKDGYGSAVAVGSYLQFVGVDELLAMFWIVELIKIIENVHSVGIIHGDVKADNILARVKDSCYLNENRSHEPWDVLYRPDGKGGWLSRGLALLDWGSAVDTRFFPEFQKFVTPLDDQQQNSGNSGNNNQQNDDLSESIECWELRNGYPWKYETDWYGVAGVAHVLLFGKYMSIKENAFPVDNEHQLGVFNVDTLNSDACPHLSQTSALKRYWQVGIWNKLFDLLLNAGTYNRMYVQESRESSIESQVPTRVYDEDASDYAKEFPFICEIRKLRHEMEDWLQANCNKAGKSLKNLLRKVQVSAMERNSF